VLTLLHSITFDMLSTFGKLISQSCETQINVNFTNLQYKQECEIYIR